MDEDSRKPLANLYANIEQRRQATQAAKEAEIEFNLAAACLIGDMRYPISKDGSVLDLTYFAPLIAWHLARCGWRCDQSKRKIKPRPITARGVVEGAVEWVPASAPDDPLENLADMTMAQIKKLPPMQRAEALRRMGGPETPDLPTNTGWHVTANLKIEDAPDPDDGLSWTGRRDGAQR
jgi:hypothetical protein